MAGRTQVFEDTFRTGPIPPTGQVWVTYSDTGNATNTYNAGSLLNNN